MYARPSTPGEVIGVLAAVFQEVTFVELRRMLPPRARIDTTEPTVVESLLRSRSWFVSPPTAPPETTSVAPSARTSVAFSSHTLLTGSTRSMTDGRRLLRMVGVTPTGPVTVTVLVSGEYWMFATVAGGTPGGRPGAALPTSNATGAVVPAAAANTAAPVGSAVAVATTIPPRRRAYSVPAVSPV